MKGYVFQLKKMIVGLAIVVLFMLLGCSNAAEQGNTGKSSEDLKPVTLKVFQHTANISDIEFNELLADPVHAQFPNITLELVRKGNAGSGRSMEELLAAGDSPDLIWTGSNFLYEFSPSGQLYDLNTLIKQNHFDTGIFDPDVIRDIQAYGSSNELYAIPFSVNYSTLFYNKDIFDKFGVAYPKDGMTWDDYVELAKKISRTENGVKYWGSALRGPTYIGSPLSLPLIDSKTDKSALNSDGWRKVMERTKQLAESVGSIGFPLNKVDRPQFLKDKTAAMILYNIDFIGTLLQEEAAGNKINWDMAAYPSFPEAPGKSARSVSHVLMIANASKHKDEAFKVLSYVTSNRDVQSASARKGRVSALKDPAIRNAFGADLPSLKDKNVQAIFKATPAPNPAPSLYSNASENPMNDAANNVLTGKMDINTALRQADEKYNQLISSMKQ